LAIIILVKFQESNPMAEVGSPVVVGQDRLPWDIGKAIVALRSIGYSFVQAIADIVDNSIDAQAKTILVRFVVKPNGTLAVVVTDDGFGMDSEILTEAMRVGSGTQPTEKQLGKYGLGLKLATFSHAQSLTIHTVKDGQACGRRLTVEGIKQGGLCDILSQAESRRVLSDAAKPVRIAGHGTIVRWDQIDRITFESSNLEKLIKKLRTTLEVHLGMCFHRHLTSRGISIYIDRQNEGSVPNDMAALVKPLDPFAYPQSGHADFPKVIQISLPTIGKLEAEAHIWPPKSTSREYHLNGACDRQGFYFYRNDRLIQAGEWNGWRETQEPHLSLARIRIELPPQLDSRFSLDVKKCGINAPAVFPLALQSACFADGQRFEEYLKLAESTYRQRGENGDADFPMVPGRGFPSKVRSVFQRRLSPNGKGRESSILWRRLPSELFFELDRDNDQIVLNSQYRSRILRGTNGSMNDAPIIKTLLFFLCASELDAERVTKKKQQRIDLINAALIAALQCLEEA
jgi:hypothetical protein